MTSRSTSQDYSRNYNKNRTFKTPSQKHSNSIMIQNLLNSRKLLLSKQSSKDGVPLQKPDEGSSGPTGYTSFPKEQSSPNNNTEKSILSTESNLSNQNLQLINAALEDTLNTSKNLSWKKNKSKKQEDKHKKNSKKYEVRGKNFSRDLILICQHQESMLSDASPEEKRRYMRNQVPFILGTQQMRFRLKTGVTTLINGSPTLNQVIAMDVTGIASWSSWANLFDEYRVHRATLVLLPIQCYVPATASTGTVNVGIPAAVCVDYDDATAIGSVTNALQYDSMRLVFLGRTDEKIFKIKAYPEGQPDMAWVTTATPTVPFWFKTYHILNPPANSMALAQIYLEVDIEFRQVA